MFLRVAFFTMVKLINLAMVLILMFALFSRGFVTASFLEKTRRKWWYVSHLEVTPLSYRVCDNSVNVSSPS